MLLPVLSVVALSFTALPRCPRSIHRPQHCTAAPPPPPQVKKTTVWLCWQGNWGGDGARQGNLLRGHKCFDLPQGKGFSSTVVFVSQGNCTPPLIIIYIDIATWQHCCKEVWLCKEQEEYNYWTGCKKTKAALCNGALSQILKSVILSVADILR